MKSLLFFLLFFLATGMKAQKPEYAVALIPQNLKENANAVVRLNRIEINISARNFMSVHTYRVVTVLNELGQKHINAEEYQDIKSISAVIYDASGNEIKKLKHKDFRETSVSEGSMITDAKVTFLDYTPTEYPFTIIYESEVTSVNTAFIPRWQPLENFNQSIEKSLINVTCIPGLGFKYKEYNFGTLGIKKEATATSAFYEIENLPALKNEQFSPSIKKIEPYVLFGLEKFNLEGVTGEATSWENFSSWYNDLLAGTDELSIETQAKIKALTANETDPIKKAKIVYQYVQDKTRYVSIQLGIGGWRPMKAKDVDRLGYGDCKALSNYTRSLLNVVGVPSFYAVIFGNPEKEDMGPDFVSMQGNHIILAVPEGEKIDWLECTNQTFPFGFQGDFTDDRLALLVKPNGGQLMRTNIYKSKDNSQVSKGNYFIDQNGNMEGAVEINSKGIKYESRLALEKKSNDDLADFYKEFFNIGNLKLKNIQVANDRDKVEFTEKLSLNAANYASFASNRMMFAVNAFNQYSNVPQRYRSRNNPFEIERGFYDEDEITITIPDGFAIEAKPDNVELNNTYGHYTAEYTVVDAKHILYKRSLLFNEGLFPAADYEKFRQFREDIAKSDNAKCVLVKS